MYFLLPHPLLKINYEHNYIPNTNSIGSLISPFWLSIDPIRRGKEAEAVIGILIFSLNDPMLSEVLCPPKVVGISFALQQQHHVSL